MNYLFALLIAAALCFVGGCNDQDADHDHDEHSDHDHDGDDHDHDHACGDDDDGCGEDDDHGETVDLGTAKLAGVEIALSLHGHVEAGEEVAFTAQITGDAGDTSDLSFYLWLEDAKGKELTAAQKGDAGKTKWHLHMNAPKEGVATAVGVRVRWKGKDEKTKVALPNK